MEFGLADPSDEDWNEKLAQRVLLKQKDSFYVPPGNVYRYVCYHLVYTIV